MGDNRAEERLRKVLGGHDDRLTDKLLNFFLKAMPSKDNQITVMMARKCYSLYRTFLKAFPESFKEYDDRRVIHSRAVGEWLSLANNKEISDNRSTYEVKLVDDTLLHGSTISKSFRRLLDYGFSPKKISAYIYAIDSRLTDPTFINELHKTKNEDGSPRFKNSLLHLCDMYTDVKDDDLCAGKLKSDVEAEYGIKKRYQIECPVNFWGAVAHTGVRRFSNFFVQAIHATSVPYESNMPVYECTFEDAAKYLFGLPSFPAKENFFNTRFRDELKLGVSFDTTAPTSKPHGVYIRVAFPNINPGIFEHYPMIRIYANYELRQVLIIPDTTFKPYTSEMESSEDFPECVRMYLERPRPNENADEKDLELRITQGYHKTLSRIMRYGRALEIMRTVFEDVLKDNLVPQPFFQLESRDSDNFLALWKNIESNINNCVEWVSDAKSPKANAFGCADKLKKLGKYEKPTLKPEMYKEQYRDINLKIFSYDKYLDTLSTIYKRTDGISLMSFAWFVMIQDKDEVDTDKKSRWSHALIVSLCDRGAGVTSIKAVPWEEKIVVGVRMRDGELSSEKYSLFDGFDCMPETVHDLYLSTPSEKWKDIKKKVRQKCLDAIKGTAFENLQGYVEDFFSLSQYEYGDYNIDARSRYSYIPGTLDEGDPRNPFADIAREFYPVIDKFWQE
jgi:hypothetical protein